MLRKNKTYAREIVARGSDLATQIAEFEAQNKQIIITEDADGLCNLHRIQSNLPRIQGNLPQIQGNLPQIQGNLPQILCKLPPYNNIRNKKDNNDNKGKGVVVDEKVGLVLSKAANATGGKTQSFANLGITSEKAKTALEPPPAKTARVQAVEMRWQDFMLDGHKLNTLGKARADKLWSELIAHLNRCPGETHVSQVEELVDSFNAANPAPPTTLCLLTAGGLFGNLHLVNLV